MDENLPAPLRFVLSGRVLHARELGHACTDTLLWQIAKDQKLVILTKDTDFYDRILLSSPPPWVVQLLCGNLRKQALLALLTGAWPDIQSLLPTHKLIQVRLGSVEGVT
ncbi:DUF5615 family PIN-like protein [Deinococcus marmoris]|uniref:DUF5615 family PIN-like protein n=1 Tax=Deinococcus marmoris TaxID=249408 RepID=UPI001115216E|nr:DUF5615 family PIN-like protein [Deinococcus marmoris]